MRRIAQISCVTASRCPPDGKAGFAAIDALVALVILSSGLALSLVATQSARNVAAQAARIRQADALCRYLLTSSSGVAGVTSGRSAGFAWRLELTPLSTDPQSPEGTLCEARAIVTSNGQARTFTLSTVAPCRQEAAA